jgi:hypothetical protein
MQLVFNVALVALVSLAASFLILAKLHRQLSHMIEGRIYQKLSHRWPSDARAIYRASSKEIALHVALFLLLGMAVGLLVYLEKQLVVTLLIGALALGIFCLLAKEIRRNFYLEEERNRSVFESHKQP